MSAAEWSGKLEDRVPVGARVKLTGVFLKNTGQRVGGEGEARWTVVACDCSMCAGGRFVALDEYPIEVALAEIAQLEGAKRRTATVQNGIDAAKALLRNSYTASEIADPKRYPRHVAVAALMPEHPRTPRVRYYP